MVTGRGARSGGGKYPAGEGGREALLTDLVEWLLTPEWAKAQYGSTDTDRTIAASKEKMIMGLLDGKTTIMTGAGSGIGKASAKLLAADGATVALVGRRAEVLDEVAHEITAVGGRAIVVPTHIESPDEVAELARHVWDEAGPVDILVNNAGSASKTRNVRWMLDEEWQQVIDVNLNAVYLLTQAVLSTPACSVGRRMGRRRLRPGTSWSIYTTPSATTGSVRPAFCPARLTHRS